MKNKTFFSKFFIVVGSLIIAILIVEIVLRIMDYHPRFMELDMFVEQENVLLPYKLRPNYEGYQIGKSVTIDSEGNRVIKTTQNKVGNQLVDEDLKTILILGDSVVFGFGLADDETIASQLLKLINESDSAYTVKNIGAPGYTSWNEYEALNKYLVNNNVDIVVLFYVFNDITINNNAFVDMKKDQQANNNPFKRAFRKNIYLLSFIKEININNSTSTNSIRKTDVDISIIDQLESTYMDQEAVNYSIEAISKIQSICEQNEAELIVAIPRFHMWYYNFPEFSDKFESHITSKLNDIGVKSYIAKSHVENLSIKEINVYRNDYHPSALAVEYLSKEIFDQIIDGKSD